MGKRTKNVYWTDQTEVYLKKYIKSKNSDLFESHLYKPITCIAEVYITKHVMPISNEEKSDLVTELISHLLVNLHHFNPKKGKGFSWISIIFKHYVWQILKDRQSYNNKFMSAEDLNLPGGIDNELMINNLEDISKEPTMQYTNDEIQRLSKLVIQSYTMENLKWYFRTIEHLNTNDARSEAKKIMNNIKRLLIDKKKKKKQPRKQVIQTLINISGYINNNINPNTF